MSHCMVSDATGPGVQSLHGEDRSRTTQEPGRGPSTHRTVLDADPRVAVEVEDDLARAAAAKAGETMSPKKVKV